VRKMEMIRLRFKLSLGVSVTFDLSSIDEKRLLGGISNTIPP
jgi:hypothetical protein